MGTQPQRHPAGRLLVPREGRDSPGCWDGFTLRVSLPAALAIRCLRRPFRPATSEGVLLKGSPVPQAASCRLAEIQQLLVIRSFPLCSVVPALDTQQRRLHLHPLGARGKTAPFGGWVSEPRPMGALLSLTNTAKGKGRGGSRPAPCPPLLSFPRPPFLSRPLVSRGHFLSTPALVLCELVNACRRSEHTLGAGQAQSPRASACPFLLKSKRERGGLLESRQEEGSTAEPSRKITRQIK